MREEYVKVYDALCAALTNYEAYDGDPDYDPAAALYEEICSISEEMQNKIDPLFQVF